MSTAGLMTAAQRKEITPTDSTPDPKLACSHTSIGCGDGRAGKTKIGKSFLEVILKILLRKSHFQDERYLNPSISNSQVGRDTETSLGTYGTVIP